MQSDQQTSHTSTQGCKNSPKDIFCRYFIMSLHVTYNGDHGNTPTTAAKIMNCGPKRWRIILLPDVVLVDAPRRFKTVNQRPTYLLNLETRGRLLLYCEERFNSIEMIRPLPIWLVYMKTAIVGYKCSRCCKVQSEYTFWWLSAVCSAVEMSCAASTRQTSIAMRHF